MSFNSSPNYGTRTVISTSILKRLDDLEKTKDPAIREDIDKLAEKSEETKEILEEKIEETKGISEDALNRATYSELSVNELKIKTNKIEDYIKDISIDEPKNDIQSSYTFDFNNVTYHICCCTETGINKNNIIVWNTISYGIILSYSYNEDSSQFETYQIPPVEEDRKFSNINKAVAILFSKIFILQYSSYYNNIDFCKSVAHTFIKGYYNTSDFYNNENRSNYFNYKDKNDNTWTCYVNAYKESITSEDICDLVIYATFGVSTKYFKLQANVSGKNYCDFVEFNKNNVSRFASVSKETNFIAKTLFINSGVF